MGIKECINAAISQGEVTREEGDELASRFDSIMKQRSQELGVKDENSPNYNKAYNASKQDLAEELSAEATERKRRALLTETRRKVLVKALMEHKNAKGELDPFEALPMLLEHKGGAKFEDAESMRVAILAGAQTQLEELLYEFRKGAVSGDLRRRGGEAKARMENFIKEAFGEDTGDEAARSMVKAWQQVTEELRQRFNSAGGAIGKLEDWGMPQHHDQLALMSVGEVKWIEYISPLLDREKMINPLTSKAYTDDEMQKALEHVYKTISTNGWHDIEPSGAAVGRGALFNQHADHRFLHFKSADDWLKYQTDFGDGDPFSTMMGHISTMTRDISFMEVLGPNPEVMMTYLRQTLQKHAAKLPDIDGVSHIEKATKAISLTNRMWDYMRGSANIPANPKTANVLAVSRNLVSAAVLGSASISALSDAAFQKVTRKFVGMSKSGVMNVVGETAKMFTTANQREAVRAGLILDSATHVMHQQARYMGSVNTKGISSFLVDRVLTYSGLTPWTQAGKHAFGMAMQAEFADRVGKSLAELPDALRNTLKRHNISPGEWDIIRASKMYEPETGAVFLRPNEISDRIIREKYIAMIMRETQHAVPEGTIKSTITLKGGQPGTLIGEISRNFAQFKTFGVAVIQLHRGRIASELQGGRKWEAANYAGSLLITGTIIGGLALQLKEISKGKDVRPMDSVEFWAAAMMQAGGLGIYGDFLFSGVNRFGGGLMSTIAGPLPGKMDRVRNVLIGDPLQAAMGDKTNIGREAVGLVKDWTPGGSLWYARAAYERVVLEQLQQLADPQAHRSFMRQRMKQRRDYGNGYWWKPGEVAPNRAPDIKAALGK
jgi:hypothetical protein